MAYLDTTLAQRFYPDALGSAVGVVINARRRARTGRRGCAAPAARRVRAADGGDLPRRQLARSGVATASRTCERGPHEEWATGSRAKLDRAGWMDLPTALGDATSGSPHRRQARRGAGRRYAHVPTREAHRRRARAATGSPRGDHRLRELSLGPLHRLRAMAARAGRPIRSGRSIVTTLAEQLNDDVAFVMLTHVDFRTRRDARPAGPSPTGPRRRSADALGLRPLDRRRSPRRRGRATSTSPLAVATST